MSARGFLELASGVILTAAFVGFAVGAVKAIL